MLDYKFMFLSNVLLVLLSFKVYYDVPFVFIRLRFVQNESHSPANHVSTYFSEASKAIQIIFLFTYPKYEIIDFKDFFF